MTCSSPYQDQDQDWFLWTKGTVAGLRNVMNVEGVDWRRTKSNHIAEVFRVSAWRRGMLT